MTISLFLFHLARPQPRTQEKLLLCLQDRVSRLPWGNSRLIKHVDDPLHRNNLRSNKFSKFILEVEMAMKQQNQK